MMAKTGSDQLFTGADSFQSVLPPTGYLPEWATKDHEQNWVAWDREAFVVCGDDRKLVPGSAAEFERRYPRAISPRIGGLAVYGQMAGLAVVELAAGVAVIGEDFYDEVGGFEGMTDRIIHSMSKRKIGALAASHSDAAKEKIAFEMAVDLGEVNPSEGHFCTSGTSATGCAYCMNIVAASAILGHEYADNQDVAKEDAAYVFNGMDMSAATEVTLAAHEYVASRFERDFTFSRRHVVESGAPAMVLAGGHAAAEDSGLLANLDPMTIGRTGTGMYRADLAPAAVLLDRTSATKHEIPAAYRMLAQLTNATAVRGLLTGGKPKSLALGVRGGNIRDSLAKISSMSS